MKPMKLCLYVGGNGVVDDAEESSFFLEKKYNSWKIKAQDSEYTQEPLMKPEALLLFDKTEIWIKLQK